MLAVSVTAVCLAGGLSWHASATHEQIVELSWTAYNYPRGAARTVRTIRMWVDVDSNGTIRRLYSSSRSDGELVGRSAYPAGSDRLAILDGVKCQLEPPASAPTLRKVLVDSIGPVSPADMQPEFVQIGNAIWKSDQGPVEVTLTQQGRSLSTRRLTIKLQPSGVEVGSISQIAYTAVDSFPVEDYRAVVASCRNAPIDGGAPAPTLSQAPRASSTN
jgi:hypothetical protein